LDSTTDPVPVDVVTPVPPDATGKVPVVSTDDEVAYTAPPEVNDVSPVPPFAVGNTPVTTVERLTLPQEGATPTPPESKTLPMATSLRRAKVVDESAYRRSPVVYEGNPVPPCVADNGVVNPESDVMSLFAPDAAAPRFVRAAEADVAPVPP